MRRHWWTLLILIALGTVVYGPVQRSVFAVRMMLGMRSLAGGSTSQNLPVIQEKISRQCADRVLDALIYRPSGAYATRALVLIPGISELGSYHPRLIALCRALADKGFLVVTPDIQMFRQFRIAPGSMDEIAFWFTQVNALPAADKIRQVGLGGISFSGTLALITAARPEIRNQVAYVLAVGAYDDPLRCSREWFAAGPVTVGPGYYPTRCYAKWIIMAAALEMLPVESERQFLRELLVHLLLQQQVPPFPPTLSQEAGRWCRLALMREDQSDPKLAQQIEEHLALSLYRAILPDRAAEEVRCPVFLVHGAHDDLIPPEQSLALRARIKQAKTYLLISPFLTHTHPLNKPLRWSEKASGAGEMFGFFYSFARVVESQD